MNNPIQKIDIVIPVYNEELNLKILLPKIINIIKKIKKFNIRIICIDDNSSDQTLIYLKLSHPVEESLQVLLVMRQALV